MQLSRRQFIRISGLTGAGIWLARVPLRAFQQSPIGLRKFVAALPGLGPTGIPVAAANTTLYPGVDFYRISVGEYRQVFHPDFVDSRSSAYIRNFSGSRLWGYADVTAGQAPNRRYLGGLIVANRNTPVRISVTNDLKDAKGNPLSHPLPVDYTTPSADPTQPENRIAVHLHGGHVPWMSDGGPMAWFNSDGTTGPSVVPWLPDSTGRLTADYWYPNDQSARLMWYHDHAHDLTRINAYVGIATGYLLHDSMELGLVNVGALPPPARTVPLIVQDKTFIPLTGTDPGGRGNPGDLWYPSVYEPNDDTGMGRWDWGGDVFPDAQPPYNLPPLPSCVPEFFSDTAIVNGMAFPYLDVQPRKYRFVILNASQARFYNLGLYHADPQDPTNIRVTTDRNGNTIPDVTKGGPAIVQIGTEGGFLPAPVTFNSPPVAFSAQFNADGDYVSGTLQHNLLLAPAERADIVIDFSKVPVGSKLILYNDAPAPFPCGEPRADYYAQAPDLSATGGAPAHSDPRVGPDTRTLMQFRVVPLPSGTKPELTLPLPARFTIDPPGFFIFPSLPSWISAGDPEKKKPSWVTRVRDLTLNEAFDEYGRLIQLIGTNDRTGTDPGDGAEFGRMYMDEPTESPRVGDVEVWRIFNLTGDTHPIHFHLVNVQLIARQPFDVAGYDGSPAFTGPPTGPEANERGWKETVRMNPGECTTVIMRFDRPSIPQQVRSGGHTYPVPKYPTSNREGVEGTYEYVWHCHILEHEEHDMMRPLAVRP